MIDFLVSFAISISVLLAARAADIECEAGRRPRRPIRTRIAAVRRPFGVWASHSR